MASRAPRVGTIAIAIVACGPSTGSSDHPDDPIVNPPVRTAEPAPSAPAVEPQPKPRGPGVAYLRARKIELAREAVPCPDPCSKGDAKARCALEADVRFLDLVAEGSHRHVRDVLENAPGLDACFAQVNAHESKSLLSFRIPLDFVIGPSGKLESREDPIHEDDADLERVMSCVGTWLDGLEFEGAGRSLEARVRLQLEPTTRCTE